MFTVLGSSRDNQVYKGSLTDGSQVAVKRLDRLGMQGDKEFGIEVSLLGTLRHANIVTLRGVCVEGDHRCMLTDLCTNVSRASAFTPGIACIPILSGVARWRLP